jgi:NAD(P)-dependent dehydrogenase (short-subunit alcohol dehydrogenase family)
MAALLQGKIAIITGAGSGVGRAACLIFAEHGAKVTAADVNGAAAQETAELVRAAGGEALGLACDVGDAAAVTSVVMETVAAFGRLDIIYNNAGITVLPTAHGPRRFIDTEQDEIDRIYRVNVTGVMNGCKAAIRQFEAQAAADPDAAKGVIVNTASVAGLTGYGGVVYGSSKGAITILTRTLAIELAPQGIRINSVCPAGMPTNFIPGMGASEAARTSMATAHPLGRFVDPADCANAALFLASDLAANITGVNLPVDGGLTAGIALSKRP